MTSSRTELRNVQTSLFIPLLDGTTLPIKFRIEQGVVAQVTAFTRHQREAKQAQ